jgi:shikimate kinase
MYMTNASHNSPFRGLGGMKIFLIGFMGSGKTFWGKKWAQQYHLDFYDLDEVIEKDQEKTVAKIFEKNGEAQFRLIEATALKTFSKKDNFILACGGGTACFNDNMKWMNENGTTVYLSATPQYIYQRVLEEKDKRPLISKINQGELLFFIEQKLKERESFYSQAKIILPVQELRDDFMPEFIIANLPEQEGS